MVDVTSQRGLIDIVCQRSSVKPLHWAHYGFRYFIHAKFLGYYYLRDGVELWSIACVGAVHFPVLMNMLATAGWLHSDQLDLHNRIEVMFNPSFD